MESSFDDECLKPQDSIVKDYQSNLNQHVTRNSMLETSIA